MIFKIEPQLMCNVMQVSGTQQSNSITHIYVYIYILFQILFPYRLLQNTECSSLCHTVGPCGFLLYVVVLFPKPNYPPTQPFPFGSHKFAFCVCESASDHLTFE